MKKEEEEEEEEEEQEGVNCIQAQFLVLVPRSCSMPDNHHHPRIVLGWEGGWMIWFISVGR